MEFFDTVTIAGTRRRAEDGALIVDARVARTGIQIYAGRDVGRPDLATVRVYRSPDEVFSDSAMASFAHRPITVDHPSEAVTSRNWRKYAVGHTGDEVRQEDKFIRVPMMLSDADSISAVEGNKRELSAGYSCELDWTSGVTADGETFDAQQKNIRINHVAIVDRGRAGPECRIGDHQTKETRLMKKTITLDSGLPVDVEVDDQASRIIDHLTAKLSTTTAEITSRDAKIGELTAEVAKLRDSALKPEQVDQMVRDRAALVATANKIVPNIVTDGKTDAEIRRAVVAAKLGDATAATLTGDGAINGAFAVIAKDVQTAASVHPLQAAVNVHSQHTADAAADPTGAKAREKRLADAWKN